METGKQSAYYQGVLLVHNTSLTIEPGTIIRMESGARIDVKGVHGAIIAEGTPEKGILFTSAANQPAPGDWESIDINGTEVISSFAFCRIEYGGRNLSRGMMNVANGRVAIHHSTLAHSKHVEVKIDNNAGFDGFSGNTLISVNGDAIFMRGRLAHSLQGGNQYAVPPHAGIRLSGMAANRIDIEQDQSWTAQGAPYIIEDQIRIQNNAYLSIEAGAELRFLQGKGMLVGYLSHGGLIVQGTPEEKVIFTSASPVPSKGDWASILFSYRSLPGSLVEHAIIGFGGSTTTARGNITVEPCGEHNPVIRHCEIHDSGHYGIYLKRYQGAWGDPLMENNLLHSNQAGDLGQD